VEPAPLNPAVLPPGIRSRFVDHVNGLRMHVLEAGYEASERPAVLMLHGFPELAYSWRKVMGPIAAAGFHVFAPDVRGYGRTSGADAVKYPDDLRPFGTVNKIRDLLALVFAMGYRSVHLVGHDQGSPLAGWLACARPDVFRSVVMMSAPFGGPPALPFNTANVTRSAAPAANPNAIVDELKALTPPRKHYHRYYQTAEANENMWHAKQGLHAFLRAYYHMKPTFDRDADVRGMPTLCRHREAAPTVRGERRSAAARVCPASERRHRPSRTRRHRRRPLTPPPTHRPDR
jgi:pimeloyl-ACP methyl ester carboxylesterase